MSYLGVTFEQNHKEHLLDSLLFAAYDNALMKAKELEGKLGISLKISSFKEIVDEKNEIWDGELNKSMRQEMQKLSFSTYEPSARFDEIELSKKIVVYFTISN